MATIIYRYASHKGYDTTKKAELDKYVDRAEVSEYAVAGIKWANAYGIITGTSKNKISPKDYVSRSQIAAILKRFCLNFANSDKKANTTGETIAQGNTQLDNSTTGKSPTTPGENENISPVIIVGKTKTKPGEEVELAVKVKNNPGILGMVFAIYYDEKYCTLVSAENGDAVKNVLNLTTSKEHGNGTRFVWDGVEIADGDIKDGTVLLLKFKISENAPAGTCPVTLKYFNDDIIDNNLEAVYPAIENGEITISK